ncbi:MAG: hypothetical protein JWR19_1595 [Pedosphaera sp.]|nr:hypothetical protein [Pedosphaera sp.]
MAYCQQRGIFDAQIVLKFDVERYDIILPGHYARIQCKAGNANPNF